MYIELFPLDKIIIDGVDISLGMKKDLVEKLIGTGEKTGNRYYYYDSEFAIDYSADNTVEYLEFIGGISGKMRPMIYGVSAFETNADELIKLLSKMNCGEIIDAECGYSYSFVNISVGVYRESTPDNIVEMIEEMTDDNGFVDDEEIEEERLKANHWATIGIGVSGYYCR